MWAYLHESSNLRYNSRPTYPNNTKGDLYEKNCIPENFDLCVD